MNNETYGESLPFDESSIEPSGGVVLPPESTLKRQVKFGVCLWWADYEPWIHPQDVDIANRFIPSNRIFQREDCDNVSDTQLGYSKLSYGDTSFRVLPAIWMEVTHEGYLLNDFVEIKSQYGKLKAGIAEIREIVWDRKSRRIHYLLQQNGNPINRPFLVEDIQPAIRLGQHLSNRERSMLARARI